MSFTDPQALARYAEGPKAQVPGFADLQRMTRLLLAETAPAEGRILVLGAGGGLELEHFAQAQPGWHLTGVDPSAAMLDLARARIADHADRIVLQEGVIHDAPAGPFDGATALLTFHFIPLDRRRPTLAALHDRLRPGARLVLAHLSLPAGDETLWLARYAAFGADSGLDAARTRLGAETIRATLPVQSPEADAADLAATGFTRIATFYQGFAFRGWVATA